MDWRLLDLKGLPGIRTQSIWHALALVQTEQSSPNTLIISWPNAPIVCVGLHQIVDLSVEKEYVSSKNLEIVRRACGGGSVYLDQNQIFYNIIYRSDDYPESLEIFYETFLSPVVKTYRHFEIPAEYSPINDIIALGKKMSGNGAVTINKSRVLVGNFILNFPSKEMAQILKVPQEKFRDKIAKTLEERMGSFQFFLNSQPKKEEIINEFLKNFQEKLNIKLIKGKLTKIEKEKIAEIEDMYKTDEWQQYVQGSKIAQIRHKIKGSTFYTFKEKKFLGGLVQLFIHSEGNKIQDIVVSGDFSLNNPFLLRNLEQDLIGQNLDEKKIEVFITQFFNDNEVDIPGISPKELSSLIVSK